MQRQQQMSITLKEFAQFMIDFVNKNFIPLLQTSSLEHERCLGQWRQVSEILIDIQRMSYWNLEAYMKNLTASSATMENKDVKEYKKIENNRTSSITYKPYEHYFDRKDPMLSNYNVEDTNKVNSSFKTTSKEQSQPRNQSYKYSSPLDTFEVKSPFETKGSNQKVQTLPDPQGFDRLVQSFRKLCSSFESNHKKLLREDLNFKQNFKEQYLN